MCVFCVKLHSQKNVTKYINDDDNDVQWSFRKTGTMRTLASQAEIGVAYVCDQAPGCFCGGPGVSLPENDEIVYAKSCNLVHFSPEMVHNSAHNVFLEL